MLENIILGCISFLLACILWYVVQYWKFGHLSQIKGPTPLPFIGNIIDFKDPNCAVKNMMKMVQQYGSVVKVWFGSEFYLLVADAELAELTLKNSNISFKDINMYRYFNRWLGPNGIYLANGDYWRKLRSITRPALHIDVIQNQMNVMNCQCEIFKSKILEEIQNSDIIDIHPFLQSVITDIFTSILYDKNFETQKNPHTNPYIKAFNYMAVHILRRVFSIWNRNDFLYQFSNDYKMETEALKIIYKAADQILNERKETLDENIMFIKSNIPGKKRCKFFIDYVLQATIDGRPLTKEEIYHFINAAMLAATDTNLGTLSYMIYEVSRNQEVQNKLVAEIEEFFENGTNVECTMVNINQLKYMEAVIKETLRYYSTVPIFVRRSTEDIKFKGSIIPKNTGLIYNTKGTHRSSKYFPNPDKFYPERFFEENKMTPYSFLGFSAGDRNCMGTKLAMITMKTIMVHLLKNFKFTSAGPEFDVKPKTSLILTSENGFHIRASKRV